MDLWELKVFLAVANERSFSRAAVKLFRTQPAISQAIRKLESDLGEQLFDRRTGELTQAGQLLQQRAVKVVQLADEAEAVVRQLRQPVRKIVTIGANEPSVQALLPIIAECRQREADIGFDVRRTQARRVGAEVLAGTLDFGVLVSQEVALGLQTVTIGLDELDVLLYPSHPLAGRERITMEEFHQQIIVVHNDPSPARDRLLRLFADHQLPITTAIISLPSLDAIKQAVEMQLGVTLLPRLAAVRELAERRLVAVPLGDVSQPRALRLAYRRDAELSPSARMVLDVARAMARRTIETGPRHPVGVKVARASRSKSRA